MSELLKYDSIIEAEKPPEVINTLSVSINSSVKKGLILDLRYINTLLVQKKKKKKEPVKSDQFFSCD